MKLKIFIEGMHCEGCRKTVENELNSLTEVTSVLVNLEEKYALVEVLPNTNPKILKRAIKECGFKVKMIEEL